MSSKKIRGLELFSGTGALSNYFESKDISMVSTDLKQWRGGRQHDIICDLIFNNFM